MSSAGTEHVAHAISALVDRLPLSTIVSLVIGTGYFVASRGVHNFYPFTVADMYATAGQTSASRLVAVDASGVTYEVSQFEAFRCDNPIDTGHLACPELGSFGRIDYVMRDIARHIDEHQGDDSGALPLRIVLRVWRLDDRSGAPPFQDCTVATCRAKRR